jgi:PAN domain
MRHWRCWFLCLALLSLLSAGASDPTGRWQDRITEEQGIDYRGGDYHSFTARSISACRSACRREDRCRAYSYNLETDTCYLKERIGSPESRRSTTSGIKEDLAAWDLTEEKGVDYRGGDYHSFRTRSLSTCKSACARDDRCRAFTHNRKTDTCYLKNRAGAPSDRRETTSGLKRGA